MTLKILVSSAALAVALLGACASKSAGSCDAKAITQGVDALASGGVRDRAPLAAAVIVEACATSSPPMPKGLSRALTDLSQSGDVGFAMLARGLADSMLEAPDLWGRACHHDVRTVIAGLQRFAQEGQGAFSEFCDVTRSGLASEAELARAAPASALVAALAHQWLAEVGTTAVNARTLARALMSEARSR
ncbi:MAG: hypothetical protein IT385_25440 [Deltaproteobacteria bacterium]|nr:hypothetical protein [Deltaproteobacteria bacterium]